MHMDPLDPYVQLVMEAPPSPDYIPEPKAPPSPDYIPGPEAPPTPDYIPGQEYPEYLPPADDSEPEMEPEEKDGDDEKSKEDSIEYPISGGYDDADNDGDDLSEDDADDEEDSVFASEETEPFEEGETAATPPPFGYHVAARISVQPHIFMPFRLESEVERLLAIHTPPLSPVLPTSYLLPPFLMPLPIFTPLPTLSFPLPLSLPSTSGSKSIPEVNIPLRKRARFTTPTGGYEIGESSVAAAARVEKYISGVPDTIHDSVKATKPKTMQEAIEFATELMDKRIRDAVENKRKFKDHQYYVEIADGRIIGLNNIMRDCTLNFLNHPFNIDLLQVELGSFDVIVGMDWLSNYDAVIACAEKLVCIPFGNEILTVREEGSNERNESRLNIISCSKAQELSHPTKVEPRGVTY
nr:reverse transcriptase domain-containing protein [Tanacetum cinerariifolium]